MLAALPEDRVHVMAVWEPVLGTDVAPPTTAVLALLRDQRVRQYWDPKRALSADLVRAVNEDPDRYGFEEALPADFIAWDVVAVFGASDRWGDDVPVPAYYGGPVAH